MFSAFITSHPILVREGSGRYRAAGGSDRVMHKKLRKQHNLKLYSAI